MAAFEASWPAEHIERLKDLWTKGWSGGQIAKEMGGYTRSAIIGKVHRLRLAGEIEVRMSPSGPRGLQRVAKPQRAKPTARARLLASPRPPRASAPKAPAPVINYANARPWEERRPGQCAFPIGQGDGLLSCCAPTETVADKRRIYCLACESVVYQQVTPAKKRERRRIVRLAA
jgi:hypothetical protein